MNNVDEVVSKVDIFAQPLEINFEPDKKHGIYLPFIATLALVVIISVSTISSLVDLLNYQKVTTTGYRESEFDQINATIPMLALKIDNLMFWQYWTKFNVAIQILRQENGHKYPQSFLLQACTRNHWKDISEEEFNRFKVSNYYCLNNLNGFSILTSQIKDVKQRCLLYMRPRGWSAYSRPNIRVHVLLFNQKSISNQKLAYENKLKYFSKYVSLNSMSKQAKCVTMEISYIVKKINDDSSFFPLSSPITRQITSLDVSNFIHQTIPFDFNSPNSFQDSLFKMDIDLSLKSIEYERNVGKITDIFAEAGGLYTAVFGVFSIVVLIYYNHKLRLKLAEYTFKSSNNSIKPSDYGFIKSLRYGTRGIVKPNENSEFAQECKRIEQNLNEVNSLVHIETILNRLQILESTLESEDKDKFLCSTMFQKSTLRKIQLKRLRIEYYSYIVQGRNSITIRDARKLYNGLGMSLEDFLNRRLKHRMQLQREIKKDLGKQQLGQNLGTNDQIANPEIEGSQRISTQTLIIFQENKSGLNTLQKVINQFRNIKGEAEQVKMIPEYDKIEVSLAKAFYRMNEKQRVKRQQKIPIIILHRLMKAIYQLRKKKQERKRKAKQDGDGKAQHLEKSAKKEEEEEFSDSIDCFDEED